MPTIHQSIGIATNAQSIFDVLQDYPSRSLWDPVHRGYRFLDDTRGAGAMLEYTSNGGGKMVVRYVSYKPPMRVAMEMVSGPWYLRAFSGAWVLKDQGATTVVWFHYNFALPKLLAPLNGPVGWWLRQTMGKRLSALKAHVERLPA